MASNLILSKRKFSSGDLMHCILLTSVKSSFIYYLTDYQHHNFIFTVTIYQELTPFFLNNYFIVNGVYFYSKLFKYMLITMVILCI